MARQTTSVPHADLADRVRAWIDEHGSPGASVAIVDGDETVFAEGFGVRRRDPEAPATADTRYGIGSSTKPVTASAVLALVDRGDLALEDAVSDYVPYFEDAPGDPITVHELLSHTSGMPADDVATLIIAEEALGVDTDEWDAPPSIDGWESFEAHVDATAHRRRLDRERFVYYNSGYVALARVVEAVTGTRFPEFVETAVLDPLGMDDATFEVGVLDDEASDAMTPYVRGEDGLRPAAFPDNPVIEPPGGLLASVRDLATFLSAQVTGGPHLDDALRERMYDPVVTTERFVDGTEHGYGYGWFSRPFGEDALVGHSGGAAVSAGYIGFLRERGLGVAVGCNASPTESPEVLAVELLATLTDRDPVSVLPRRALDRKLEPLTGEYESTRGVRSATVTRSDSCLEIEQAHPMGRETATYRPTSLDPTDREFATVGSHGQRETATFYVSEDGVELLVDWGLFQRVGDVAEEEVGE